MASRRSSSLLKRIIPGLLVIALINYLAVGQSSENPNTERISFSSNDTLHLPMELIDGRIKSFLQHLRLKNPTGSGGGGGGGGGGIPGIDIPDPMPVPDLSTSFQQIKSLNLSGTTISGLSAFIVDNVRTNLVKMELTLALNFTELLVRGNYSLKGKVSVFPISGNGAFWMNVTGAQVLGNATLEVTDGGHLRVQSIDLDVTVDDMKLHFENLLGKGFVARLVNALINSLRKIVFESVKKSVIVDMRHKVKDAVNEQFDLLPPQPLLLLVASPLDLVLAKSADEMRRNKLDPFPLPPRIQEFQKDLMFVRVRGSMGLKEGYLNGLSTLHRTGDVSAAYGNNTIELSANMGFDVMEGGYKWTASFMGVDKEGGVFCRLESVDVHIVLSLENELGASPKIKSLEIKDMGRISTDVDGVGSVDFVLELAANLVSNIFKQQIIMVIQGPMRHSIQENLDKFALPF